MSDSKDALSAVKTHQATLTTFDHLRVEAQTIFGICFPFVDNTTKNPTSLVKNLSLKNTPSPSAGSLVGPAEPISKEIEDETP